MTQKCIECGRVMRQLGVYCKKCEAKINQRIEKKEQFNEKYKKADFFERMRLE